jgi:hypothetical protein
MRLPFLLLLQSSLRAGSRLLYLSTIRSIVRLHAAEAAAASSRLLPRAWSI